MTKNSPVEKYPCQKCRILEEHSKENFIRSAWIQLANEDAPLDLFDQNFGDVKESEHQIMVDSISATMHYTASVGYDRQEPYTDYETYYEDEPYQTTERYYDSTFKEYRTRQVTKYKKVERQRQVTKYKTVTDWSPISGTHRASSSAFVENATGLFLDDSRFSKSRQDLKMESLVSLSEDEEAKYYIHDSAHDAAFSEHRAALSASLKYSLPGDHNKSVDCTTDLDEHTTSLYIANEYSADIVYKGKTYTKKAFPFGSMKVGGDKVQNPTSLDKEIKDLREGLTNRKEKREKEIDTNIWRKAKGLSTLTFALLGASLLVSAFIRSFALVILTFLLATTVFIYNKVSVKKFIAEEKENAKNDIALDESKTSNEINNFSEIYKEKQREALNKKLKSLNLEPAKDEEIRPLLSNK